MPAPNCRCGGCPNAFEFGGNGRHCKGRLTTTGPRVSPAALCRDDPGARRALYLRLSWRAGALPGDCWYNLVERMLQPMMRPLGEDDGVADGCRPACTAEGAKTLRRRHGVPAWVVAAPAAEPAARQLAEPSVSALADAAQTDVRIGSSASTAGNAVAPHPAAFAGNCADGERRAFMPRRPRPRTGFEHGLAENFMALDRAPELCQLLCHRRPLGSPDRGRTGELGPHRFPAASTG